MDHDQLKISGTDPDEVIAAAKAVVSANGGKYDPAFDRGDERGVFTVTIHRLVKLGAKTKDGKPDGRVGGC
jgi:hypothetical protein